MTRMNPPSIWLQVHPGAVISIAAVALGLLLAGCSTSTVTGSGSRAPQPREYAAPVDEVWSAAVQSMASLGWTIAHTDRDGGVITATTPPSVRTYGDQVSVLVASAGATSTRVEVASVSTGQVYDWGKGRKNIVSLYEAIAERLRPHPDQE